MGHWTFPPLRLLLLVLLLSPSVRVSEGKRVSVPDDLDDVVDDEEDEAWKEWGRKKQTDEQSRPPPPDLSKMDVSEIQAEMMKRHVGPSLGFVKLRPGAPRSRVHSALCAGLSTFLQTDRPVISAFPALARVTNLLCNLLLLLPLLPLLPFLPSSEDCCRM